MNSIHRHHRIFAAALLWAAALLAPAGAAAQSGGFTIEQIMSSPFPAEMTAAPRGARLAWTVRHQGRRNVWVAEGPGFAARQLTPYNDDSGQEIGSLAFSHDGATVVYVRGGNRNQAGEVPNPSSDPRGVEQAVWAIPFSGGEPRRIDEGRSPAVSPAGPWVAYLKGSQVWLAALDGRAAPRQIVLRGSNGAGLSWSPDGTRLMFVSNRGTHSWIAIYDLGKESISFVAPSVDRDSIPRWSPDGTRVVFVRIAARPAGEGPGGGLLTAPDRPNPWTIWVADLAANTARQIWASPATLDGSIPRMAGDALLNWAAGERIVFASEMDGWQRLYSIAATGGEPVALTPAGCEFEQMSFTPDRRVIVYSSNCGDIDRRHLWRVAVSGGAPETITSGQGLEWGAAVTADGGWIAYFASDARWPAMPWVRPAAGGEARMLAESSLPGDFPAAKLVTPQQVILEAADGVKFHNQLFLPPDMQPGRRYPAVIFMHGGPVRQMLLGWHNRGYYHSAYGFNQYLASQGYVVLSVNFRSGIGYGRAFREAENRGARGASEYQDIVAAGKYLAARGDVDPARIGLWGGSYGGYLTAMGLARDSGLFAAGVDLHGVHDWSMRQFGGGLSGERARVAVQSSPVADVDKWKSPVLLVHGDDDRNVDFIQTIDLAARLRARGVTVELLVYPDEVHDFLLHRNWLEIFRASADFFDRHLKRAPARAAEE